MAARLRYIFLIVTCVIFCGCAEGPADGGAESRPVRVAVLPDQIESALIARHTPLIDHLERATSLDFELSLPADYEDLLVQFDAGRIDLAWFGGLTFVRAELKSNAVALAFRDVDLQFTSCYLAKASDTRRSINEFEGESFSFGPRLSTSGHLMPRYYLKDEGLDPESFFSTVRYSAGHDETARMVAAGAVPLGVANCVIVQSLFDNGSIGNNDIRVIDTTPPYSDYVWAVHPSMGEDTRTAILDALLALDATTPEHHEVLRLQGANTYLPAGSDDFDMVRMAAESASLLAETDAQ